MKYKTIAELIKDREWTRPDSYIGPQHFGYVIAIGQNRDSDVLSRANFKAMRDLLGRWCSVERASHWACGWVEYLMVSVTATKTLEKLREALNALEDYPVLDDLLFSEMEMEERDSTFDNYRAEFEREVLKCIGLESWLNEKELESVARAVYQDDCDYRGVEDAWINANSISRWAKNKYTEKLEGNVLAGIIRAKSVSGLRAVK